MLDGSDGGGGEPSGDGGADGLQGEGGTDQPVAESGSREERVGEPQVVDEGGAEPVFEPARELHPDEGREDREADAVDGRLPEGDAGDPGARDSGPDGVTPDVGASDREEVAEVPVEPTRAPDESGSPDEQTRPDRMPPETVVEATVDSPVGDTPPECPGECCNGSTRACYTGKVGTRGVGACKPGIQTCTTGAWGATCVGQVVPSGETCNGTDDDCDGKTDEDAAGQTLARSCYDGAVSTRAVGECKAGRQICTGGGWPKACSGQQLPAAESCNGKDDDCDGMVDQGLSRGCKTDCGNGTEVCASGSWVGCTAPKAAAETCNLKDDDCDGLIDNLAATACHSAEVLVPAGAYTGGSPASESGRQTDETQHTVTITQTMAMWRFEVTQGLFKSTMGYNPAAGVSCGADCPVAQVTWHEAAAFCNALSAGAGLPSCFDCTGQGRATTCAPKSRYAARCGRDYPTCTGYRLPTEAEWERAYRAGTSTSLYNGDLTVPQGRDPKLDPIAWYKMSSTQGVRPVGGREANRWGLYDMAGNVREWCWDWYGAYPSGSVVDPVGPGTGSLRVARGGSATSEAGECRAASRRSYLLQAGGSALVGLRPVRTISAPSCKAGSTRPCYLGPIGTSGMGPCRPGNQACAQGLWGPCLGQVVPKAETCNNGDDDCNGKIDDGLSRSCFTCAGGAPGKGPCKAGIQSCVAGVWGGCVGEVCPKAESCNNIDDDCDGSIDQGLTRACYTGPTATRRQGICRDGRETCSKGSWGACVGQVKPAKETCNNKDDDCNTKVDDGVWQMCYPCSSGKPNVGICRYDTQVCSYGKWGPCGKGVWPKTEVCNGVDDDCDGQVDEAVKKAFYEDKDKDGFGNPKVVKKACTIPAGFVANNRDCCDTDKRASPTSSGWFGAANNCGSFDYNCDGTATKRWTTLTSECTSRIKPSSCSAPAAGWRRTVTSCGASHFWQTGCTWNDPICEGTGGPQVQECR